MAALASVPLRRLAGMLLGQIEPPLAVRDHASPGATYRPFISATCIIETAHASLVTSPVVSCFSRSGAEVNGGARATFERGCANLVGQVLGKRLSNHVGSEGYAGFVVVAQTGSSLAQSLDSTRPGSVDTNFHPLSSTTSSQSTFSRPFST
eukprot:388777-Pleurochrysis_carterae.AAC.1